MLREFTLKIFIDERVKKPGNILSNLFGGNWAASYSVEIDKYVQWEELRDKAGNLVAENTVIDWGL